MTRAELLAGPLQTVLELRLGGVVVRVTDGPALVVEARSEATRRFAPGLEVDGLERAMAWLAGDLSPRSVSCSIHGEADWPTLAGGPHLWSGTGELAQLYPGQAWEDRRRVLQGQLVEAVWGDRTEPFAFALSEDPGEDRGELIPLRRYVCDETFPREDRDPAYSVSPAGSSPDVEGAYYPLVIGYPGAFVPLRVVGTTFDRELPASPALYVERTASTTDINDHTFLVAGGAITATHVKVFNFTEEAKTQSREPVFTGVDKLGQQFSFITPGGSGGIPTDDTAELWTAWLPDDGGGIADPFEAGATLRRADHVIRWALAQSTLRVDHRQMGRLSALAAYQIDGFINEPVSPWEWLRSQILPLLPVSVVVGPDGLYIAPWTPPDHARDAVAALTDGLNASRISPVSATSPDEVVNHVEVAFNFNGRTGQPAQRRVITGAPLPEEVGVEGILPEYWARRSQLVYGRRVAQVSTAWVSDAATAEQIGRWMVRARAFPRRQVTWRVSRDLDWLRPGDTIALTSTRLALSAQPTQITSLLPRDGDLLVGLQWWEGTTR